jgi:endonuclease YncB( thermonuclease family)
MRALTAGIMAVGLVGLGLCVVVAGNTFQRTDPTFATTGGEAFGPPIPPDLEPSGPEPHPPPQSARAVAPSLIAPPPVEREMLVRAEPRDPLGPLGQAQPPRKKQREGGNLLFNPVATASARFEAMGYEVAIAGTQSIDPAETCTYKGTAWPCGIRARTAVRLWLRGRALACDIPPGSDEDAIVVGCRLGKDDVGAWLVTNGWAHAAKGGPYVEAEAKAREAGLGIFGAPPASVD